MTGSGMQEGVSRREFVRGAAALGLTQCVAGRAQSALRGARENSYRAYVGTYTGAIGGGSNGEGIYLLEMNAATGELSKRKLVARSTDPSWIAIHPSRKYLYAVNEVSDFEGNSGSVSAFAIEEASGELTPLNVVSSGGAGPCYLSIDGTGKYAFVANYGGGTVAVLPILDGGRLGKATDVKRDTGNLGAANAADAPEGSFAVSGHDAPHAHMVLPDAHDRFVLATDLGQDRIYSYRFDAGAGKLIPAGGAGFATLPSGDGPRHFAFHRNGHWLYAIQEEASNVAFFHYDEASGALSAQQTVSTLPKGFAGTSFASEILISPDGKFLYAANRLHDAIAVFVIGADGRLKLVGETSTMGDYPGQCRIDPRGEFLYACNRRSDSITCFRIHSQTGWLTFTGRYTGVGSPASITFVE